MKIAKDIIWGLTLTMLLFALAVMEFLEGQFKKRGSSRNRRRV